MSARIDSKENRELEARIKALEVENARLAAHNEEIMLWGWLVENIDRLDSPDSILKYTVEQFANTLDVPFCAFCEILDDQAILLHAHTAFREEHSPEDQIDLPKNLSKALEEGALLFSFLAQML